MWIAHNRRVNSPIPFSFSLVFCPQWFDSFDDAQDRLAHQSSKAVLIIHFPAYKSRGNRAGFSAFPSHHHRTEAEEQKRGGFGDGLPKDGMFA
jgi:hypothetical protein